MFGKMKGMMDQMQLIQKMMKDENFRAFISHPKIQEMFKDPELQEMMKKQDMSKMMTHPKFAALREDSELAALAAKLNLPKPQ